jgi:cell division protein FtsB
MVKGGDASRPFFRSEAHFAMRNNFYWVFIVLIAVLAGLQYRLWVGDGSLAQVTQLQQQIADQQGENQQLQERNRTLEAEVLELKSGMETVEERARHELGMLKEGETLYQLAE